MNGIYTVVVAVGAIAVVDEMVLVTVEGEVKDRSRHYKRVKVRTLRRPWE